ncbi:MAG: replication-associated recombination protein A [Deltaproteobacteria bacterium]|nr:replication-associated recombination protein A [Deltaproteobacteria bacterium]
MPPDESLELFGRAPEQAADTALARAPLAERMRPRSLDELLGQDELVAPGSPLRSLVDAGALPSIVLWGPPGSGKTTLARAIARASDARFEALSAVMAGVKEIRQVVERARREARPTLLFLDELHRLNRVQQDALLPHVEAGTVTLVGATTENPSFEVNAPLLSRCRVFTLRRLDAEALAAIVRRAAADTERGIGRLELLLSDDVVAAIAHEADGDARRALGLLEAAAAIHRSTHPPDVPLTAEAVSRAAGRRLLLHDRDREEHYNVVSAFIKSLRASDPDAALYYATRMLDAGEDPLFIARRLVIFASEDIGNADSTALSVAISVHLAVERIGMPEGRIPLAQAITHLACAPKSNAAYLGLGRAQAAVAAHGSLPVPMHLRNAPTRLMKGLGYGRDYEYPHDAEGGFVAAQNLPEGVSPARFYEPTREGSEAEIADRLAEWRRRRDREG